MIPLSQPLTFFGSDRHREGLKCNLNQPFGKFSQCQVDLSFGIAICALLKERFFKQQDNEETPFLS